MKTRYTMIVFTGALFLKLTVSFLKNAMKAIGSPQPCFIVFRGAFEDIMRSEFSKATKRGALERSQLRCEAIGEWYNLAEWHRCNAPLGYGVQFDHIIADSHGGDNSLDNCAAICRQCHDYKTRNRDTPQAAKIKRISDKHLGIRKPKSSFATNKDGQWKRKLNGETVRR